MERPMLFNTEMVKAILDGRKTQTRRLVKPHLPNRVIKDVSFGAFPGAKRSDWIINYEGEITNYFGRVKPPCQAGYILWVRETWCKLWRLDECEQIIEGTEKYYYLAGEWPPFNHYVYPDGSYGEEPKWKPSIHMPKEAARIWLKVTNVRVERLQDITTDQIIAEGVKTEEPFSLNGAEKRYAFSQLWDSTIKKENINRYSWEGNPWVWVIEFERCGKPQEVEQ